MELVVFMLLGLVGTIAGMMSAFGNVAQSGLNDAAKLARDISFILNATLIGLLIAIPSLIFWSYYNKKVETLAVEMETLCDEFIRRQYRVVQSPPVLRSSPPSMAVLGNVAAAEGGMSKV